MRAERTRVAPTVGTWPGAEHCGSVSPPRRQWDVTALQETCRLTGNRQNQTLNTASTKVSSGGWKQGVLSLYKPRVLCGGVHTLQ